MLQKGIVLGEAASPCHVVFMPKRLEMLLLCVAMCPEISPCECTELDRCRPKRTTDQAVNRRRDPSCSHGLRGGGALGQCIVSFSAPDVQEVDSQ
jgi:hypothetical protein